MTVKRIVSEERMLLPELRDTLLSVEAARLESGEEMSYEFRKSIEHANQLTKASSEKGRALVDELLKLEKMKEEIAYRIANLMPRTRDELRAIYAKERFNLTTEELDEILDLVMTHF
ncbi:RNA polymerase Rpb4 family protein [Methanoculleus sp. Afa-1]|jgi:DNA-directed RNA polymerase subunit F|uniref:DNA-directed RNA polymerase subunit Rpo4 n=1 Tax=Methanoculleus formosensis TaxID=2590886 RepID=A0A9E4ZMB6_9EURY|nr:RNA polymerase Rpb4 family protein [Methanoculleus sp. Afa-1]MCT8336871.1 RNA polymerase Rpb4 family protein [Methanoculleus sp. Afa-1]